MQTAILKQIEFNYFVVISTKISIIVNKLKTTLANIKFRWTVWRKIKFKAKRIVWPRHGQGGQPKFIVVEKIGKKPLLGEPANSLGLEKSTKISDDPLIPLESMSFTMFGVTHDGKKCLEEKPLKLFYEFVIYFNILCFMRTFVPFIVWQLA